MPIPYASASSGKRARDEISKTLLRLGCGKIAFGDNFDKHESWVQFEHRGRLFHIPVSAKGWAAMYLKQCPWTRNHRSTRQAYEQKALEQGHVAANSILRDWCKAQVTAIEAGMLSLECALLPYMLTADGRPLIERLAETNLLPAPQAAKVVSLSK